MTQLEIFDKYLLRKPLYSQEKLFSHSNSTFSFECLINNFFVDEKFRQSLFWSSPQFFSAVEKMMANKGIENGDDRIVNSLIKYIIRATTRTIPFGTFAGFACVSVGKEIHSETFNDTAQIIAVPSAQLLDVFKRALENDKNIRPFLNYVLNDTIYSKNNEYRFLSFDDKDYKLSSLGKNSILDKIYEYRGRKISRNIIRRLIPNKYTSSEVDDFIEELTACNFLISDFSLNINEMNDLNNFSIFIDSLDVEHVPNVGTYEAIIEKMTTLINFANRSHPDYQQIIGEIQKKLEELSVSSDYILNLTVKAPVQTSEVLLSEYEAQNLTRITECLYDVISHTSQFSELDRFKDKFLEIYDDDEIQIMELLDPELGLGFPINEGSGTFNHNELTSFDFTSSHVKELQYADSWLTEIIEAHYLSKEIILKEADLPLRSNAVFPSTFNVIGTKIKQGQFLIQSIGGNSAKAVLGRFALYDNDTSKLCKEIAQFEIEHTKSDVIFAEVNFIPLGAAGNIVRRPKLADYVINIFSKGDDEEKYILPIQDIYVKVLNGEVILWSKKLRKRIVPRISNAHNYTARNMSLYHFLGSLQRGKNESSGFDPNILMINRNFIPRISYRNIVICKASWRLTSLDIKKIFHSVVPLDALKQKLVSLKIPQFFCIIEEDTELLIDSENKDFLQLLLTEIKNKKNVLMSEYLQETSFSNTDSANYVSQIIIPFKNNEQKVYVTKNQNTDYLIEKKFLPGSEWLYYKVYCPCSISDKILLDTVLPMIDELLHKELITSVFFVRYNDPDFHLRIRFFIIDKAQLGEVFSLISKYFHNFQNNQDVWKLEMGTYTREIERYGAEFIKDIEKCFFYDTKMILSIFSNSDLLSNSITRMILAVKNLDAWLEIFNLSINDKIVFCSKMENLFYNEFNRDIKKKIYSQYRDLSFRIHEVMISDSSDEYFIKRKECAMELVLGKDNLSHLIHMSLNRWFSENQRLQEYMTYIFALKYYKTIKFKNILQ